MQLSKKLIHIFEETIISFTSNLQCQNSPNFEKHDFIFTIFLFIIMEKLQRVTCFKKCVTYNNTVVYACLKFDMAKSHLLP